MNSKTLAAHVELLRPLNGLMMMAVIAVAVILAQSGMHDWTAVGIAALVGGLVGTGANAINDFFDIEIDRVNRPDRPLPRGAVSPNAALILWLIFSVLGISLNVFLDWTALCIAAFAVAALFLYSARLKGTVLAGNLVVAFMTGLAFVYGAEVAGHPERAVVPAVFAFLINLGREIVKDVEDMQGDFHGKAITFPLKFGVKKSLALATVVFVLLIGCTLAAFFWGGFNEIYLALVLIVDGMLAAVMVMFWRSQSNDTLATLSKLLKLSMVVGLAAIYFGS